MPVTPSAAASATFRRAPITRFVKFGIVGGSGVVVNAGMLYAVTELSRLDYRVSSVIAIECAILSNFYWNRRWTWADRHESSAGSWIGQCVRFNVSSGLVAFVVNWGLLVALTEYAHLHYQLSNLIGIACGTAANFLVSHFWTFAPRGPQQRGAGSLPKGHSR